MTTFDKIRFFFDGLSQKKFKQYGFICLIILLVLYGLAIFHFHRTSSTLIKRIQVINNKRREVKHILERYEIVKKQQAEVAAILSKEVNFKIGDYFNKITKKLNVTQNKTREPETSREELDNEYTEIKLYASFSNMNTQKLTELLDAIEQTDRIYTKEVEIYKPDKNLTINVNILIATLELTTEAPGTME